MSAAQYEHWTRFLLRLIPWNHFFAWIQFSFSLLKMGVAKRHHVNSPATTWIQCAIKRSHFLGHVFGPLIQLLDMYSHKKVFEELRFGQVREEGAGHTGTGYEGHNWLLQTVDTDTDHHVRKKPYIHCEWIHTNTKGKPGLWAHQRSFGKSSGGNLGVGVQLEEACFRPQLGRTWCCACLL